jgi:hypothetical protein
VPSSGPERTRMTSSGFGLADALNTSLRAAVRTSENPPCCKRLQRSSRIVSCRRAIGFSTYCARNTFMTSSPRCLMTFTAIRPDFGLGKSRDVSLRRVAQASSLISPLSVVLRAV